MRILFLSSVAATPAQPKLVGGAEVIAGLLADGLAERGHEIGIVRAVAGGGEDISGVHYVVDGAAPNLYPWAPSGHHNAAIRAAWHLIDDWGPPAQRVVDFFDQFRPDVLVSHSVSGISTGMWLLARKRSIPTVHTLHDYYLMCPRTTMRRADGNCMSMCTTCRALTVRRRRAARTLTSVVGVSRRILERYEQQNIFAPTTARSVIHNVVPTQVGRDVVRGWRAPITLGYIGRGIPEKGLPILLDAFAQSSAGIAELVIAGRMEPELTRQIEENPRRSAIRVLGFVEKQEFFDTVDVVVVPSLWEEPFATVILEAQAAGRAVVGSNRGGTPEAIGGAEYGWLFDPDRPDELATVLGEIATEPGLSAQKGAAARQRAATRTMPAFLDAYEEVYAGACRGIAVAG